MREKRLTLTRVISCCAESQQGDDMQIPFTILTGLSLLKELIQTPEDI
jgi:hypothetical protein